MKSNTERRDGHSLRCSRSVAVFEILDSQDFTGARMKSCLQESLFLLMGHGRNESGMEGKNSIYRNDHHEGLLFQQ